MEDIPGTPLGIVNFREVARKEPSALPPRKLGRPKRRGPFVGMIPYDVEREMFAIYCQMPNLSHVARTTGVSVFTVRKYAREQDWETRRLEIVRKAREASDYTLEKATEQSITIVRALKQKIAQKIQGLAAQELSTDGLVSDTERLVKLEQILLGGVQSRSEHIVESHEQRMARLRQDREKVVNVGTVDPKALGPAQGG